ARDLLLAADAVRRHRLGRRRGRADLRRSSQSADRVAPRDRAEAPARRSMKVLVPGIAGRLGKMLAERLVAIGHDVIGIDRRPFRDAPSGVEMHELDIRKRAAEEVFRRVRPDAVIHMATVTHLMARSEDRYRINLGGTRAVFEHSAAYGVE